MVDNVLNELPGDYSMVLSLKPSMELDFYKAIGSINNPCLLLSLGRPATNVNSILKKHGISHKSFHIIDAISMEINEPGRESNSSYLPSARNLGDIALEIENRLRSFPPSKKTLIFDSVSKLAKHHDTDTLVGFLKFLDVRLKDLNTRMILLTDHNSGHLKSRISGFVDKVF